MRHAPLALSALCNQRRSACFISPTIEIERLIGDSTASKACFIPNPWHPLLRLLLPQVRGVKMR